MTLKYSHEDTCVGNLSLVKVIILRMQFYQESTPSLCFLVNFPRYFRIGIIQNNCQRMHLGWSYLIDAYVRLCQMCKMELFLENSKLFLQMSSIMMFDSVLIRPNLIQSQKTHSVVSTSIRHLWCRIDVL